MNTIRIQNARVHNLKSIDVEIPRDKFTVVTGISGSGKTSLVYDVLYKKARDTYLDAIGIHQRHSEETADSIKGLCPVVAVEQKNVRASSSRSVVGTRTNIFDYLRLLFAQAGVRNCIGCGGVVTGSNPCTHCGQIPEPFPKGFFSFNTISGKCGHCQGRGYNWAPSVEKIMANPKKPIKTAFYSWLFRQAMEKFHIIEKEFHITVNTSLCKLDEKTLKAVIFGWGDFPGFLGSAAAQEAQVNFLMNKCISAGPGILERYYERRVCPVCGGMRLGSGPLSVRLDGRNMGELSSMTLEELGQFLNDYERKHAPGAFETGLLHAIQRQIKGFRDVNLSYLTLYRTIPSLSGGEIQRLFIMRHISSNLESALFIFDEPTAGLHEAEKTGTIKNLKGLSHGKNGLIIVEHDRNTIEMAEHIVDIGPMAGKAGGRVVYNGPAEGITRCEGSITGQYLSGKLEIPTREQNPFKAFTRETPTLQIRNACANNLKNLDLDIPLGMIVGIAGVSGSGKSTLTSKVLIPLLHRCFKEIDETDQEPSDSDEEWGEEEEEVTIIDGKTTLSGTEQIDGYADVAQIPISRFGTSTPLSYLGLWDRIRKIYASQPEAAARNFTASHFSFKSLFSQIPEEAREIFLSGRPGVLKGVLSYLAGRPVYERMQYTIVHDCPFCHGMRLRPEALRITVAGRNITKLSMLPVKDIRVILQNWLDGRRIGPARVIQQQLKHLEDTGLGHLILYRPMPTLSGGEAQRLFLASHLESEMGSVIYIFDEPTSGLHEREKQVLIEKLQALKVNNNTVIAIEHDRNTIAAAEHIIDFGPLGGEAGGEIICSGSLEDLLQCERSITGAYLKGTKSMPVRKKRAPAENTNHVISMHGVRTHNLKNIDVDIPLGMIVGIMGVSGSGKSSLIADTLVPTLVQRFGQGSHEEGDGEEASQDSDISLSRPIFDAIHGLEHLSGFCEVSQKPIGRSRRSIPLSYAGIWDDIRKVFAAQPAGKKAGFKPGHFSFNSDGACGGCRGMGSIVRHMGELGFMQITCPDCGGIRYSSDILKVLYRGKNISDVLNMSISDAAKLFAGEGRIAFMLETLERTGLGYLRCGQAVSTLSGGEAQRVKLAEELGRQRKGNILYILDEPTTGLSFHDTALLLELLEELCSQGNSILIIEHDPDVLSFCDYTIELGPGGGNEGGAVVSFGYRDR